MFQQIYQTALPLDDKKRENMDFIKNGKEMYISEKIDNNVVDFVIKYFHEVELAFNDDLDSKKFNFEIKQNDETKYIVQFDYVNMSHLLGMNAASYRNDSSDSTFFNQFCANYSDFLVNLPNTIMEKFSRLFNDYGADILNYEQNRNPKLTDSLNWVRIAYKIFCFLNIGDIGTQNDIGREQYFFTGVLNNKKQLYILRKFLSESNDDSYILLSFNITDDLDKAMDPESIKMVHIDKTKIIRNLVYHLKKRPEELVNEFRNVQFLRLQLEYSIGIHNKMINNEMRRK